MYFSRYLKNPNKNELSYLLYYTYFSKSHYFVLLSSNTNNTLKHLSVNEIKKINFNLKVFKLYE